MYNSACAWLDLKYLRLTQVLHGLCLSHLTFRSAHRMQACVGLGLLGTACVLGAAGEMELVVAMTSKPFACYEAELGVKLQPFAPGLVISCSEDVGRVLV